MAAFSFPQAVNTTLDADGHGQVDLYANGGDWVITTYGVNVSTATNQPTAKTYRGFVSQANYIEGSFAGANDSSNTRIVLQNGQGLSIVWDGGDPGAKATATFTIVQYPPGQAPSE